MRSGGWAALKWLTIELRVVLPSRASKKIPYFIWLATQYNIKTKVGSIHRYNQYIYIYRCIDRYHLNRCDYHFQFLFRHANLIGRGWDSIKWLLVLLSNALPIRPQRLMNVTAKFVSSHLGTECNEMRNFFLYVIVVTRGKRNMEPTALMDYGNN